MNAILFYEVLLYCFIGLIALAGLIALWNCWAQCCTSEEELWATAARSKDEDDGHGYNKSGAVGRYGYGDEKVDGRDSDVRTVDTGSRRSSRSPWQWTDVSAEEFTLIPIPDVRSCGVQTSGTLERAFVARYAQAQAPRRTMFLSTQV